MQILSIENTLTKSGFLMFGKAELKADKDLKIILS